MSRLPAAILRWHGHRASFEYRHLSTAPHADFAPVAVVCYLGFTIIVTVEGLVRAGGYEVNSVATFHIIW